MLLTCESNSFKLQSVLGSPSIQASGQWTKMPLCSAPSKLLTTELPNVPLVASWQPTRPKMIFSYDKVYCSGKTMWSAKVSRWLSWMDLRDSVQSWLVQVTSEWEWFRIKPQHHWKVGKSHSCWWLPQNLTEIVSSESNPDPPQGVTHSGAEGPAFIWSLIGPRCPFNQSPHSHSRNTILSAWN